MQKNEKKIINGILDSLLKQIDAEALNAQNPYEKSRLMRNAYRNKKGLHRTLRTCAYPGCTENSIKRSHTIQKNCVLKTISESNHVYTPEVDMQSDTPLMRMRKIGINDASTFPGFCSTHELLFEDFEKRGSIESHSEALLQTFRAICREIVFRENEKGIKLFQRDEYFNNIEQEAQQYILSELKKKTQSVNIGKISLSGVNDYMMCLFDNMIHLLDKIIEDLNKYMLAALNNNDIATTELNIDHPFPIAIAGFGNQKYVDSGEKKECMVILNVIPYDNRTTIICSSLKEHESIFQPYVDFYTQNTLTILNLIESFMIHASDHWYINPSYWDSMPRIKKRYILQCLLYTEESFLDEAPYSIFDDIRMHFLEAFMHSRKEIPLTMVEKEPLDKERSKLNKNIELKKDIDIIDGMNKNMWS